MRRNLSISISITVFVIALAGCQGRQAKIEDLQKEYDAAAQQFRTDCTAETLNMPKQLSAKCADEQKRMNDAYQRLQAKQQER
jgi:hypothetical protein